MSDAQDAARYRWIRSCFRIGQHGEWVAIVNDPVNALDESQFDRQIDSAMREDAAKSERAAENKVVPPSAEALAAANESHTSRQ